MDKSFFTKIKKAVEPVGEIIPIAVILLFLGIMAGSASAATLTVDYSDGADYSRIQDAIDNASAGDTIIVYSGTYYENVNVNKQLTLRSIGVPVVDAGGSGSAITLAADGITLEGFTATKAAAGILVTSNNNTLSGNNASSNTGYTDGSGYSPGYGYGIYLSSSSNNTLIGNNASSNTGYGSYGSGYGYGIYLSSSNNNTLSGNNASSNYGSNSGYGYGIYLSSSSNNTLIGNNAILNTGYGYSYRYSGSGYGISLSSSSNNTLSGNNASSNSGSNSGYGISLYYSSNNTLIGNNASMNTGYTDGSGGIDLYYSSNNRIYNNIFNNTNNVRFTGPNINSWNTTLQFSPNIIGGPYLGGNFWANPNGTGFSQNCADTDKDGICDSKYSLDSSNTDYLPLARESGGKATWTVDDSGGANFTKIQDAIDNARSGDTILVYSGTYYENVNVIKWLILKGIDIGGGNPVVNANGSGSAITLSAGNSMIEGFRATGSSNDWQNAGIFVNSDDNLIRTNNVLNNENGIFLSGSNNMLSSNNALNNQYGISLISSGNNTLSGNNASNNSFDGIFLSSSNDNLLIGNNVSNNGDEGNGVGEGIELYSSDHNILSGNSVSNNMNSGISLSGSRYNKLGGNNASNNRIYGIGLGGSSYNMLSDNNASNNRIEGIDLGDSRYNTLTNNIMKGNRNNFAVLGEYDNQIDTTNLVNEKPIYYVRNAVNTVYDSSTNAGTFYCINCVNVTIKNMSLNTNYYGIFFWNTTFSRIQNIDASNNGYYGIFFSGSNNNTLNGINASNNSFIGVFLSGSNNNTLNGINASNNDHGIDLISSSNNRLGGNNASNNNFYGIALDGDSSNNTLSVNDASNNSCGIFLGGSSNNTLVGNIVSNNMEKGEYYSFSGSGIYLISLENSMLNGNYVLNNVNGIYIEDYSNNNIIYNNIFNNNINNIQMYNSINRWNITKTKSTNIIGGPYIGGNVWGWCSTDSDKDGICDSPYALDSNNIDYLPLTLVSVLPQPPIITSFAPSSPVNDIEGAKRTFNITVNQIVNITWLINGTEVFNKTGLTTSSYTNSSAALGIWNVTAVASNENGTAMQTWVWIVTPVPTTGSISGYKINDTNGNGKWDAGEAGIQGWNITLKNTTTGAVIASNLTDANGFYQFFNIVNGSYNATEEMRTGFNPTNATFNLVTIAGLDVVNLNFTNQPMKESVGSIMNPGFENGTAKWIFYSNGIGTFSIISPGYEGINAARVALKTNGSNIQLYQKGIILEPNTRYRLSFAANSTSGHDLEVNLIQHGSPYTNYGLAYRVNLSKSWQTFMTEFTSSGFKGTVNDGRLMFWMTPFAASGDTYYIDNVQLEKV